MEENIEVWKDIEGYEGIYQVSNMGQVKSLERVVTCKDGRKTYILPERILKPSRYKENYLQVVLSNVGKKKTFKIHQLVARTFIPNPQNLPCVNHRNEIKTDNRVENLEWVTQKENLNYGTIIERKSKSMKGKFKGEKHPFYGKHHTEETKQKLKKPIIQLDLENNFVRNWDSATTASKELKINIPHITACCRGKRNKCGGYKWVYKSDYKPTYTQLELIFD